MPTTKNQGSIMSRKLPKLFIISTILTAASLLVMSPLVSATATVTTNSATNVVEKSATLNGNIQGSSNATSRGFEYGTSNSFGNSVSDPEYEFDSQIGIARSADGQFNRSVTADVDSAGNVYIVDARNNRIQKFDSSGNFISKWGSEGSGDGEFSNPRGIAIDSSGNVYVADTNNSRVQKFDSSGNFISKWGSNGSGDGDFNGPSEIDIDTGGNIYVVEGGYTDYSYSGGSGGGSSSRIQKFDSSGNFISKWGSEGSGDGEFHDPKGISIDSSGSIYVADTGNNRIQKFDSSGNFISKWGTQGTGDGEFGSPTGVAIDSFGDIYIADTGRSRIQKFDSSGNFISKWGTQGTGDGEFDRPYGVALDSGNNFYVIDSNTDKVQKFNSSGAFVLKIGDRTGNSQLDAPLSVVKDGSGDTYVADSSNNRIQKFDSSGNFITKWGSYGAGDGEFDRPTSIVIDGNGDVLVVDAANHRIQKFDSDGNFITKWGSNGSGDGQFSFPSGITVDSADNVYVVDGGLLSIDNSGSGSSGGHDRIQKFDSDGNFITKWGSNGSGDGQFSSPQNIAIDSSDNVYVADVNNHRIQKFDSDGNFITKWGSYGSGDGQFSSPIGVTIDSSDNIFVANSGHSRIQKFDSDANFLLTFGSYGDGGGNFRYPRSILIDNVGNLFVADSGNNLVQKITPITVANEVYSSDISGLFCNTDYYYRAYVIEGGTKVYGSTNTFKTSTCTGADLKLSITLNEPGLVVGQSASYTFTFSNVGLGATWPIGYLIFTPPLNVELGDISSVPGIIQGGCQEVCYLLTYDPDQPPDFENDNFGTFETGSSLAYTLPFNVIGPVDASTSIMKGLLLDYSSFLGNPDAESDSVAIGQLLQNDVSFDDLLALTINNAAFYQGVTPGASDIPDPGGSNTDQDNISDEVENAAPNSGDANNDGTPDSEQDNVASFVDPVSEKYAVLEVSDECSITSVLAAAESTNTSQDTNYNYPNGLMDFTLDCGTPGFTATVTQYYYGASGNFVVRKYNPNTNTYSTIDSASISNQTIGGQPTKVATYQVKDGSSLDLDNTEDGNIHDPAGLAQTTDSLANTGQNTHNIELLAIVLLTSGLAVSTYSFNRRRKGTHASTKN